MDVDSTGDATATGQSIIGQTMGGIYSNTSVANRTFFIQAYRAAGGGTCQAYTDTNRPLTISVIPLDQPSNSALYVQGPVLGANTGAAISAGYVGEKLDFTTASISATTTGITANTTALTTLTPGVWMIVGNVGSGGNASLTGIQAFIATGTNNAADQYLTSANDATVVSDPAFGGRTPMIVLYYKATTSTPIYAKAKSYGANTTVTVQGYAVRIN